MTSNSNYDGNRIYSVSEFAKRISSSRSMVLRMIDEGKIIAFRLSDAPRSSWRIRESEIDRLISLQLQKRFGDKL